MQYHEPGDTSREESDRNGLNRRQLHVHGSKHVPTDCFVGIMRTRTPNGQDNKAPIHPFPVLRGYWEGIIGNGSSWRFLDSNTWKREKHHVNASPLPDLVICVHGLHAWTSRPSASCRDNCSGPWWTSLRRNSAVTSPCRISSESEDTTVPLTRTTCGACEPFG